MKSFITKIKTSFMELSHSFNLQAALRKSVTLPKHGYMKIQSDCVQLNFSIGSKRQSIMLPMEKASELLKKRGIVDEVIFFDGRPELYKSITTIKSNGGFSWHCMRLHIQWETLQPMDYEVKDIIINLLASGDQWQSIEKVNQYKKAS